MSWCEEHECPDMACGCTDYVRPRQPVPAPAEQATLRPAADFCKDCDAMKRCEDQDRCWAHDRPLGAPAEQAETPKGCSCGPAPGGYRYCDDHNPCFGVQTSRNCSHGQLARSCDRCEMQQEIAALRAEVARLTADKAQTIAEFDQAIRDGQITVHVVSWKARAEQAEAENARLTAENDFAGKLVNVLMNRAEAAESSRQADRDTLRQQIKALGWRQLGACDDYNNGIEEGGKRFKREVLALLGERREEPTQ